MKERKDIKTTIETNGSTVEINRGIVKIEGRKGSLERRFLNQKIKIEKKDNIITLTAPKASKKDKRMIGTFSAHLRNMVKGANEGFTSKLKICSGHFPMNVSIANNEVIIKNFLGEKIPRKAKILEGIGVKIDGDIISINGINKELVGQTTANIENAVKIRKKDRRIFQDGIYKTEAVK